MEKLKRKSLFSSLPIIIILAVAAAVFLIPVVPGISKYIQGAADLDELDYDGDLDGIYAKGTIYVVYDYYCETREDGKLKSREYIIDAGENYYMGMLVGKSNMSKPEALMDAYWSYLDNLDAGIEDDGGDVFAAQYEVSGTIVKMPSDSQKLYYGFLTDSGTDRETAEQVFLPYYLEVNRIGESDLSGTLIFLLLAAALIAVAVVILVRVLTGANQKQIKQYIAKSSSPEVAAAHVESFLAATEKDGAIRYNNEFICGQSGSTTIFREVRDLVWAYQKTITHKRYFITVGHSYYVVLGFRDGKRHDITMKNEAAGLQFLASLENDFPAVVLGYNDDLDKLYRNDMPHFLELKYNNQSRPDILVQEENKTEN